MTKCRLLFLGLLIATALVVSSCGDDDVSVTGISLNKTALFLEKGSSETLVATVQPKDATNQAVVWTSSNPNVATVSEKGLVSANSSGSAVIIATTRDGQFTATCQLTVQVSVSKITLSSNDIKIEKGESATITAVVSPEDATDKNLIWTAKDPSIASVDNSGKIVALDNGSTIVSVTNTNRTIEAECKVTVITSVVSILLDKTELSLVTGQSYSLIASIIPETASNKNILWTSSNDGVATVSSEGKVTAVKPGTTTIVALTEDKNKTATCVVTVVPPTHVDYTPYGNENNW